MAPKHMQNDEAGCLARHGHVTCANFSRQGEIVATYNDEVDHPAVVPLSCDCNHWDCMYADNTLLVGCTADSMASITTEDALLSSWKYCRTAVGKVILVLYRVLSS